MNKYNSWLIIGKRKNDYPYKHTFDSLVKAI